MTCPRCGRPFPVGDPRELVPGRQCFACDEQDAAGWAEDRCRVCGTLIGIGHPLFHLGLCELCKPTRNE